MKDKRMNSQIDHDKIAKLLNGEEIADYQELNEFEAVELEQCRETLKLTNKMHQNKQFNTDKAWNNLHSRLLTDQLLEGQSSGSGLKYLNVALAVAASVILFVGLSVGYLVFHKNATNLMVQITNTENNNQAVTLPDGTTVHLNLNAQLSYPEVFNDSIRLVELKGEGFFEVKPNPNQPFVIHVGQSSIRVLGTSFNVKSLSDDNNIEVIVKTGIVQFCDCSRPENKLILEKGEKGMLFKGKMEKSLNTEINYLGYVNQKLIFKATPLNLVIQDINKAYHSQIEFGNPDLNQLTITTTFDGLTLDELLKSISLTFDLRIEKQDKKVILVKN